MGLFARLLRQEGYSVSLDKVHCTFHYREQGRRLQATGEAMADGYAVYSSSIQQWENAPAQIIDDTERQRIAGNIRRYFVDRGKTVYIA